jgi:hypothetical protein
MTGVKRIMYLSNIINNIGIASMLAIQLSIMSIDMHDSLKILRDILGL